MKSSDPASVIKSLLNRNNIDNNSNSGASDDSHDRSSSSSSSSSSRSTCASMLMSGPLIKTCGMINVDDVKVSLSSGANLIGSNRSNDKILFFIHIYSFIYPFIHPSIYASILLPLIYPLINAYKHQSIFSCMLSSILYYLYIGIIFAEASKRCITDSNIAKGVVNTVRLYGERNSFVTELNVELGNYRKLSMSPSQWFLKTGQLYVLSSSSRSRCSSCCRYVKSVSSNRGISVKCKYISTYSIVINIIIIIIIIIP